MIAFIPVTEPIKLSPQIVANPILYWVFATCSGTVCGQTIDADAESFVRDRVPSLLEIIQRFENEGEVADFNEALEWVHEIRDEYREVEEEFGEPWAGLHGSLAGVGFDFDQHIAPTLERYCFDCHDADSAKGDVDLESALRRTPLVRDKSLWDNVAERIRNGDMPPEDEPQPDAEDRLKLRDDLLSQDANAKRCINVAPFIVDFLVIGDTIAIGVF